MVKDRESLDGDAMRAVLACLFMPLAAAAAPLTVSLSEPLPPKLVEALPCARTSCPDRAALIAVAKAYPKVQVAPHMGGWRAFVAGPPLTLRPAMVEPSQIEHCTRVTAAKGVRPPPPITDCEAFEIEITVVVTLQAASARALADWTRAHVGRDALLRVGSQIVLAPRILEPITTGRMMIQTGTLSDGPEPVLKALKSTLPTRKAN
jgi:hypothetical protein